MTEFKKYQRNQILSANHIDGVFIMKDGRKLYPRLLIHEWNDKNSFHGFHMMKRQAEDEDGHSIKDAYIFEIYPPSWLNLPYSQVNLPMIALTPEDALDGMLQFIDEYSKKNLEEAKQIRQKALETLDEA